MLQLLVHVFPIYSILEKACTISYVLFLCYFISFVIILHVILHTMRFFFIYFQGEGQGKGWQLAEGRPGPANGQSRSDVFQFCSCTEAHIELLSGSHVITV